MTGLGVRSRYGMVQRPRFRHSVPSGHWLSLLQVWLPCRAMPGMVHWLRRPSSRCSQTEPGTSDHSASVVQSVSKCVSVQGRLHTEGW